MPRFPLAANCWASREGMHATLVPLAGVPLAGNGGASCEVVIRCTFSLDNLSWNAR